MTSQDDRGDRIIVQDAPPVPGLSFRRFRGDVDLPAMVAVLEGSRTVDGMERSFSVEQLISFHAHLPNFDPARDVFFTEVEGHIVGFSRLHWFREAEGTRVYFLMGFLLPEWRRRGIGRAMLRHSERLLRDIAATHPDGGPRMFYSWTDDTAVAKKALLCSEGYTPIRHFYQMVRPTLDDLPDALLPPGLKLRPVRPEHYHAIWDASQDAFGDTWGFMPEPEESYQAWLREPTFDPTLWRVAWDGDQVAGQVRSYIDAGENVEYHRLRGYTQNISVRRPWRRRGLARALLALSLQTLEERGMTEAALSVDAENESGALRLYESCGFRVVKQSSMYAKPMT
ncbi:MAG TPA: GNAT family N-acetyltransferase [Ardenticatenaceae bacterium]|nr:GNAT family N-acetyltransferase [Ardenticatenaceae bacterium]